MSTPKTSKASIFSKIKDFSKENETKLVLFFGFLLISAISFQAGVLQGQKWQQKPLIIERQVSATNEGETANLEPSVTPESVPSGQKDATITATAPLQTQNSGAGNCAYVGSKNSTKFYTPNCSWAKSIKPENLVCFKTSQEALAQGRTESKCTK